MSLFFRVSGIVFVLLAFLGVGFVAGEHVARERVAETKVIAITSPVAKITVTPEPEPLPARWSETPNGPPHQ